MRTVSSWNEMWRIRGLVGQLTYLDAGRYAGRYIWHNPEGWVPLDPSQQGDITMPTPEPGQIWRQGTPHRVITARVVEVDDGRMVIAVDDKQDPYRVWTVRSFMANWEPVPPPSIVLRSSSIEAMTFTNPTRTQVVMWADGYPLPPGSLKEGKRYKITLEEES